MTLATLAEPLTYWLIAVNFAAFVAFGLDKARAEAGAWRISEGTLIGLAFLGGTLGAYAGRWAFRHKTRKVSFTRRLGEVVGVQGALVALAVLAVAQGGEVAPPSPDEPLPAEVAALVAGDDTLSAKAGAAVQVAASGVGGRLIGCKAVRAAGRAPVRRGDPDYHPALDADGDGIGCEPLKAPSDG